METEASGFPSTLTPQQAAALEELQARIEGSNYAKNYQKQHDGSDWLLRVLRATMKDKKSKRIFQPEEAFSRACAILDFKVEHDVWTTPQKIDLYRKAYPRLAYKDRKLGRVVNISRFGEFASTAKWGLLKEEEWAQCMGFEMERTEQEMSTFAKELGVDTQGYVSIADASGLSLKILGKKKATQTLANISGFNYPEMLSKVYIVNAPWIFSKVFGILKPLLDPQTVAKLSISSGVPEEFKTIFDLELLPTEFGGMRDIKVPFPLESKHFDENLIQAAMVE